MVNKPPKYIGTDAAASKKVEPDTSAVRAASLPVSEGVSGDASITVKTPTDDRAAYAAEVERICATRQPFGQFTQKLALPKRPGYHRHWFNDSPGRVDDALTQGWTHVKGKDNEPLKRVVGTGRDNGALIAYAMEIPEVFWEEDMAERNKAAMKPLEVLKSSPFRAKPGEAHKSDAGKFYSPVEGQEPVQITNK